MANSDKNISSAVIKRLPRYFRYLGALKAKNIPRISSKELSEQMMVTASQIRQDLNNFGGGKCRYPEIRQRRTEALTAHISG